MGRSCGAVRPGADRFSCPFLAANTWFGAIEERFYKEFLPKLGANEFLGTQHDRARSAYISVARVEQPAPAPRFSRTPPEVRGHPPERGEGGAQALTDWGLASADVARLKSLGLGLKD